MLLSLAISLISVFAGYSYSYCAMLLSLVRIIHVCTRMASLCLVPNLVSRLPSFPLLFHFFTFISFGATFFFSPWTLNKTLVLFVSHNTIRNIRKPRLETLSVGTRPSEVSSLEYFCFFKCLACKSSFFPSYFPPHLLRVLHFSLAVLPVLVGYQQARKRNMRL